MELELQDSNFHRTDPEKKMAKLSSQEVGQDLMIYNEEKEEIHILNTTAKLIYELYLAGKDLHEIESAVRDAFDVADEDIAALIRECLDEIRNKGLFDHA